jgi:hypothetical protein
VITWGDKDWRGTGVGIAGSFNIVARAFDGIFLKPVNKTQIINADQGISCNKVF